MNQNQMIIESLLDSLESDGITAECKIGSGNFSSVYKGKYQNNDVAIKFIVDNESALQHEIEILKKIKGLKNAIQIFDIETTFPIIVLNYVNAIPEKELKSQITVQNLRMILRSTLECLSNAHKIGIVHQDIKLSNILVSQDFKAATVIDWGCSHFVSDSLSPLVGSRLYRSPEMLMRAKNYRTAGDVWAVGVIILKLLLNGKLPWDSSNADLELVEMSKLFGGDLITEYAIKLGVTIKPNLVELFSYDISAKLEDQFSQQTAHLQDPLLIDLMKSLLTFDKDQRPTAEQALQHPFFQ